MPVIQGQLLVEHLTVGPFMTNVYLVGCMQTKKAAIVDAGGDAPGLIALAKAHQMTVEKILQTHAHVDHVGALAPVAKLLGPQVPILMHRDELPLYQWAASRGEMFGITWEGELPEITAWIEEGDVIEVGELRAQALVMPGHSPGSVIFYFKAQETMLSGDVLFQGSVGRVDLPLSSPKAMAKTLERLVTYPDATRIYSGHGPDTSLGMEKRTNPFLQEGVWD